MLSIEEEHLAAIIGPFAQMAYFAQDYADDGHICLASLNLHFI